MTSPQDERYNCIAFAAGDTSRKWDATIIPYPGYYWPPGVARNDDPETLRAMFESIGYEWCGDDGSKEPGYEKVAIYVNEFGEWSHAAKQADNGDWCSKLGDIEDVRHKTPHCFGGSIYGSVLHFMKLKLPPPVGSD